MSGPWEKYANSSPAEKPVADGPWSKYATAAPMDDNERWLEGDALEAYRAHKASGVKQPSAAEAGAASAKESPIASGVLATAGGVLEGIPVAGPAIRGGVERAGAGALALRDGASFDDSLATVRAMSQQAKTDHPYLDTGAQIAGGIVATAPLVAAAPAAFGAGGGSLLARSALSGGTGMILGGTDTAVRSGGDTTATKWGTGIGALAGAVSPAAGQLAGRGVNMLVDAIKARAAAISNVGNAAASKLAEDFAAAGGRPGVEQRLLELGPEAMMLDASPSFMGRAQGLAVRPESRELVVDALMARNKGTNSRLATELDSALGPSPLPSQVQSGIKTGQEALGPDYARVFEGANVVDIRPLADALEAGIINTRGRAQDSMRQVRKMLDIHGNAGNLDPNPQSLFSTRQAIDGMLATEADPNTIRALTSARTQVDDELARAVPGIKDVDAQYAELARQSEGLQRGSQVLDGGKTAIRPQDLTVEVAEASLPQASMVGPSAVPLRMRQGVRAEVDRLVGTSANDLQSLKQAIKGEGDWNRAKLAQVFGEEEAGRVFGAVDREAAFRDAYNKIVENSQTQMRAEAARGVGVRGDGPASENVGLAVAGAAGGLPGVAGALGVRGFKAAGTALGRNSDLARNEELARLLLLREGPERAAVIEALEKRIQAGDWGKKASEATEMVTRAILHSQGGRSGESGQRLLSR